MLPPVMFMVTVTLTGESKPSIVAVAPLLLPLTGLTVPSVVSQDQSTLRLPDTSAVEAVSSTGTPHQLSAADSSTVGAGSTVTTMVSDDVQPKSLVTVYTYSKMPWFSGRMLMLSQSPPSSTMNGPVQ